MTKGLSTIWTKHLKTKEEKKDFEDLVRNSRTVLDVVLGIVTQKINEVDKTKDSDYEKAAWPFLQADRQGQIRAYKYIKELLTND